MSKFWYYTIHKCPDCGATYDEYNHTAPWCDSGLSSSPVIAERCPDCWEQLTLPDRLEEAHEMLQSAKKYLCEEWYPDWSVIDPVHILNDAQIVIEKELGSLLASYGAGNGQSERSDL